MLGLDNLKFAIVVAALVVATTAGWVLNGWRLSGKIENLQGVVQTQQQSLATLQGANMRCTAAVGDVRDAVAAYVKEGEKRAAAATVAMQEAAKASKANLAAAKAALSRPPAKAGEECATVAREAAEYAKKRKAAP